MIRLADLNQQASQTNIISLHAVIDTALCVGAGGSAGSLADKPILKNAAGHLVIPASQLKGRLRHECEKLTKALQLPTCESPVAATMCPQRAGLTEEFHRPEYAINDSEGNPRYHCQICQIFGNPALPSRVLFNDLICTEKPENIPEVLRPGVTINRRRRTAEEKKLYFLETSPANAKLRFEGTLMLQTGTPAFAKALLLAGLQHIHALGGSKSSGLGWLHWEFPQSEQIQLPENAWNALKLGGGRETN
ncbi:MAG: RAMP superfamily CRISPR-associated protein [Leptolyngbyaceae cyanobacterium bins.302]|nr:RAMP superfamily CRISPR-associated protein [Leptolyngbyaceae cyanobacterium bins.302]